MQRSGLAKCILGLAAQFGHRAVAAHPEFKYRDFGKEDTWHQQIRDSVLARDVFML